MLSERYTCQRPTVSLVVSRLRGRAVRRASLDSNRNLGRFRFALSGGVQTHTLPEPLWTKFQQSALCAGISRQQHSVKFGPVFRNVAARTHFSRTKPAVFKIGLVLSSAKCNGECSAHTLRIGANQSFPSFQPAFKCATGPATLKQVSYATLRA